MRFNVLIVLVALVLFAGCGRRSVEIQYQLPQGSIALQLYHSGVFSTYNGEDEIIGTMTATWENYTLTQTGEDWTQERQYLADKSKGYHKNSMPMELSWRVPQVRVIAPGGVVQSVRGYERFVPDVVEKLPLQEKFKRQLRDARYQLEFDRYEKRRWELEHFLKGKIPLDSNITARFSEEELAVGGIQIDSVVTKAYRKLDGRRCFEYALYFEEREPFPYFYWEQHAYGTKGGEAYRDFRSDSASYHTEYTVMLEPSTGVLCQVREVKQGLHIMKHRETGERAEFRSQTTLEHLYNMATE